jgi:hypothetical protein
LNQKEFEILLDKFFSQSSIPTALWQRLLEKEKHKPQGILEIPGRVLFATKSAASKVDSVALRKKIPLIVLLANNEATVISDGVVAGKLELDAFLPSHSFFKTAFTPPSRQVRVATAKELTATASSLLNKLALLDPESSSQPSDWMPLVLNLMRIGICQSFTGSFFDPERLKSSTSNLDRTQFANSLLAQLNMRQNDATALLPNWTDPIANDLVEKVLSFGYANLSVSALVAYLHKLGSATEEAGLWGYFADGDALSSLVVPVIDRLREEASKRDFPEHLSKCVFLDPTDSPGSILAELIETIGDLLFEDDKSEQIMSLLAPERFVALVSNTSLGQVNSLAIWFALSKSWQELGLQIQQSSLDDLWGGLQVRVSDQLESDWLAVKSNANNQLVIVGSPKFAGANKQTSDQKQWVEQMFKSRKVDYSACWLRKGAQAVSNGNAIAAFVLTNSVCQGEQVGLIWPKILSEEVAIAFARPAMKWSGTLDARTNSGVSVVVVGLAKKRDIGATFYSNEGAKRVQSIGPYLVPNIEQIVKGRTNQISSLPRMVKGNMPFAESLLFDENEFQIIRNSDSRATQFIKKLVGSSELAKSSHRYCIWITSETEWREAEAISAIRERVEQSRVFRETSTNTGLALTPWRFRETTETKTSSLVIPSVTSESREYIPIGFVGPDTIVSNLAFAVYDSPDWLFALLTSKTHEIWLRLVSGGLETRIRYSNLLSYNTFPAPRLSQENQKQLIELGSEIVHFRGFYPEISLGQLYSKPPMDLRQVHRRNDSYVASLFGIADPENVELTVSKLMQLYVDKVDSSAD